MKAREKGPPPMPRHPIRSVLRGFSRHNHRVGTYSRDPNRFGIGRARIRWARIPNIFGRRSHAREGHFRLVLAGIGLQKMPCFLAFSEILRSRLFA